MSELSRQETAITYLHDHVGICSHCGKKKCAGKQNGSRLPAQIPVDIVLEAIRLATVSETRK